MPGTPESEKKYLVEKVNGGVYVTDEDNGNVFFGTREGNWFWTGGPEFPFDEDVALTEQAGKVLSGLVGETKKKKD